MNEPKRYWQDVVSLSAGIWLMLTLWVGISTDTATSAWLAYMSGGFIAAFAAGGFQDNAPLYSWLTALFGLVAVATPWIAGISADPLATWTIAVGGIITVVSSSLGALAKKAPAAQPQLAAAE